MARTYLRIQSTPCRSCWRYSTLPSVAAAHTAKLTGAVRYSSGAGSQRSAAALGRPLPDSTECTATDPLKRSAQRPKPSQRTVQTCCTGPPALTALALRTALLTALRTAGGSAATTCIHDGLSVWTTTSTHLHFELQDAVRAEVGEELSVHLAPVEAHAHCSPHGDRLAIPPSLATVCRTHA